MTDGLDPTTFTDREAEIAREGYNRGYKAADRFWRGKLAELRRVINQIKD